MDFNKLVDNLYYSIYLIIASYYGQAQLSY